MATELAKNGRFSDPARAKLIETRTAVVANWMKIADTLDQQGDVVLAGDVRYFAKQLPPALTGHGEAGCEICAALSNIREATPAPTLISCQAPTR